MRRGGSAIAGASSCAAFRNRAIVPRLFLLSVLFVFLTIVVESANLFLQLRGRRLSRWFGKRAFRIHVLQVLFLWITTFSLIIALQFGVHHSFHRSILVKCLGVVVFVAGLGMALWALRLLGLRRALGLNFFEQDVPVVKRSLYKRLRNPMDIGFLCALVGFSVLSGSSYNLALAAEFIVFMIPHVILENQPLKRAGSERLSEAAPRLDRR